MKQVSRPQMQEERRKGPDFDPGNPPTAPAALLREMKIVPGRVSNMLQLLAMTVLTLIIGEYFHMPDVSVFVWIGFFMSGNDAGSTLTMVSSGGAMIIVGTALVILLLMVSLSEPALRLPLMFVLTLAAGFLSQASTAGTLFNTLCFWIVYNATNADTLIATASSIDAYVGNTTQAVVSDLVFLPPEEAMLHSLLWTGLVFAIALALILMSNKVFGRDPAVILRHGLAARLQACADFCDGKPGAREELQKQATEGVARLRALHQLTQKVHRNYLYRDAGSALIRDVGRLVLVLLAWDRTVMPSEQATLNLEKAKRVCLLAHQAVISRQPLTAPPDLHGFGLEGPGLPLAHEVARTLALICEVLHRPTEPEPSIVPEIIRKPSSLLKADALTNPVYWQASIKLLISVSICYGIERFCDWSAIHTCVITCFLVSLNTVGATVHKMLLRLSGALVGAILGIGAILLFMPMMTDLSDLMILILPVIACAAWVKAGTDRISYAGTQMAFAFYLCVLQGYGPTLDMETGRDRVIGVLIGNVVVYVVGVLLWPVSVSTYGRAGLGRAVGLLGDLITFHRKNPDHLIDHEEERLREAFGQAIASVRDVMVNDPLETGDINPRKGVRPIDQHVVTRIHALIVPVSIALRDHLADALSAPAHGLIVRQNRDLKQWFDRFSDWIKTGSGGDTLRSSLPSAEDFHTQAVRQNMEHQDDFAARDFWYRRLESDLRVILDEILPPDTALCHHAEA